MQAPSRVSFAYDVPDQANALARAYDRLTALLIEAEQEATPDEASVNGWTPIPFGRKRSIPVE